MADFLVGKGIKLLVVACNTASAFALTAIKERYGIPVVLITHDPADIDAFPGTVVNYSAGKICAAVPSARNQLFAPTEALCSR